VELMPSIMDRRGTPHPGELEGTHIELPADPAGLAPDAAGGDPNLRDEVSVEVAKGPPSRRSAPPPPAAATASASGPRTDDLAPPAVGPRSPPPGGGPGIATDAGRDAASLAAAGGPEARAAREPEPSEGADGELRPWGLTSDLRTGTVPAEGANGAEPRGVPQSLADQLSAPAGVLDSSLPRPRSPARMSLDERFARRWTYYAWAVAALALLAGATTYVLA